MAKNQKRTKRSDDLAFVQEQLQELQLKAQGIQTKWQRYNQGVSEVIQGILEKAGVWEEVQELEQERAQVRADAQGKLNQVQVEINSLNTVRSFLAGRAADETPTIDDVDLKPVEGVEDPQGEGEDLVEAILEEPAEETDSEKPEKTERKAPPRPNF